AYSLLPGIRRLAFQHVAIAFGDTLSASARKDVVRASYRSAARCFVELAKMEEIKQRFDEYTSVDGLQHWEDVRALGRGAVVVTGHNGNWELLAYYVTRMGVPLAASARRIPDPRLDRLLTDFRANNGMRVIHRDSPRAGQEILRVLKRGGLFA